MGFVKHMTKLDGSALDSGLAGFGETAISRIQRVIHRLRSSGQQDWMVEWCLGTGERAILNEKGHIAWAKGRQAIELVTLIDVTKQIELMSPILLPMRRRSDNGLVVRLGLTWWAERAEVWVNGRLVQEGDLFDHTCRVILGDGVAGDGVASGGVASGGVEVRLKLVSPGHDGGALMRSRFILEAASGEADGGLVADEVEIVSKFLTAFYPDELPELADRLDQLALDGWEVLSEIRSVLYGWSDRIKQYKIQCLGHAHLDLAWLWTVDETWEVAERTFLSALNLMKDFPELIFGHTTPVMYEWFEVHRPEIFRSIQNRVQAGKWEPIGGLWVEPEINVIGGESIARQILYGQRYYEEKFGRRSRVAWLPDTFGFCGQLPQLLALGGMDYFVTQKLRWNDTTKVPYDVFSWQSPDGSQVLALMSAPIGEWIDPIKMSDYCWDFATRSGLESALYLPGVGDHGGGPTRDMLDIMQRWQTSDVFPTIEFTTAESFLNRVIDDGIPVHHGELYLEFHRGCYTTHGDQKSFNRDCENALYEAELWASLAALTIGFNYPKTELEHAWKKTLFNQFHDILPGTSIREVYPTANRAWEEVLIDTDCIINNAKDRIISAIAPLDSPHPDAQLIVVFNPNHWTRSQLVGFVIADSPANPLSWRWQLQTLGGQPLETDVKFRDSGERLACIIRSIVPDVPALGYACYWAVPVPGKGTSLPIVEAENYQLENEFLQVEINAETGDIHRIFDRKAKREVLQGDSNQLLSFKDDGQYWDAWNIDPNYKDHPLPAATLQSIRCIEKTNLRSRIEIVRTIGNSTFTQTYSLTQQSPILEIQNYLDWQEKHILVKAGFSFNLAADWVTYESACGIVDRTTRPETDAERAMWEVPGLRWASISDGEYGVSLLCDRKHGYDHTPNSIRISLLRGSEFPDPIADQGIHEFTIGVYPHAGNWKTADTPKRALELSLPLQAIVPNERLMQGRLPGIATLLNLQASTLMLMAIKQSEADRNKYILRGYEYQGESTVVNLENTLEMAPRLRLGDRLDLLENPLDGQSNEVQPWTIASFEVLVEDS